MVTLVYLFMEMAGWVVHLVLKGICLFVKIENYLRGHSKKNYNTYSKCNTLCHSNVHYVHTMTHTYLLSKDANIDKRRRQKKLMRFGRVNKYLLIIRALFNFKYLPTLITYGLGLNEYLLLTI